jgi:hypothetical protein
MYSSLAANSAAITSSSFQNTTLDSKSDIKQTKTRSYGTNLSDLSMRAGSTLPLNEDSNEPLLEGTVNNSQFTELNTFSAETGGQTLNSDTYLCGVPSLDRFCLSF